MKERPILFSGPMVRAILKGQKTVTRRVVKASADVLAAPFVDVGIPREGSPCVARFHDGGAPPERCRGLVRCPYGAHRDALGPGDLLWVRETWALLRDPGALETWALYAPEEQPTPTNTYLGHVPTPIYAADGERPDVRSPSGLPMAWRPSIHMPRWASRLTLRVTDVRVERLHAIDEADAIREGIPDDRDNPFEADPRTQFVRLWERINGARAPWASNPWVWRVAFEVEARRGA